MKGAKKLRHPEITGEVPLVKTPPGLHNLFNRYLHLDMGVIENGVYTT